MADTPSFPEIVRRMMEARLAELHTALPARVEFYDPTFRMAKIQPLVKRRFPDGKGGWKAVSQPVVVNVPVVFPKGGGPAGYAKTWPISRGDIVLALFAEQSLDVWLARGGDVDPGTNERHSLTDAIAVPGLLHFTDPAVPADPTDVVETFGQVEFRWKPDGTIVLKNTLGQMEMKPTGEQAWTTPLGTQTLGADGSWKWEGPAGSHEFGADGSFTFTGPMASFTIDALGAVKLNAGLGSIAIGGNFGELLDILSQTLQLLSTAVTATLIGPQPLSVAPALAALKVQLDLFKGTL